MGKAPTSVYKCVCDRPAKTRHCTRTSSEPPHVAEGVDTFPWVANSVRPVNPTWINDPVILVGHPSLQVKHPHFGSGTDIQFESMKAKVDIIEVLVPFIVIGSDSNQREDFLVGIFLGCLASPLISNVADEVASRKILIITRLVGYKWVVVQLTNIRELWVRESSRCMQYNHKMSNLHWS